MINNPHYYSDPALVCAHSPCEAGGVRLDRLPESARRTEATERIKIYRCLHYGYQESGLQWHLHNPDPESSVPKNCVMWSNNGEVLKDAAAMDQGIVMLPRFVFGDALQKGQLQTVLTNYAETILPFVHSTGGTAPYP